MEPQLSLNQPEETLLNEEDKKRYQSITCAIIHLVQVSRDDTLLTVSQLARVISKPSKAHMGAAEHLLRSLTGSVHFSNTYKRGGVNVSAYSDVYYGNNPDYDK